MRIKTAISSFSLIILSICFCSAQTPERISRLIDNMPCSVPVQGTFWCEQLSGSLSFYSRSEDDAVVQVGAHLFANDIKVKLDTLIVERVERLWLEMLLRRTPELQGSLLKEYGIRMVLNGYLFGRGNFCSLDDAMSVIRQSTSVEIVTGGREIDFAIIDKSVNSLHFYIPADRDLLFPWDKKEAEDLARRKLRLAKDNYVPVRVDASNAISTTSGVMIAGGECYMIDSLRNDVFLISKGKTAVPVFGGDFPVESLRNMLMSVLKPEQISDWNVSLRFRSYTQTQEILQLPIGTLLMFLRNQGLKAYTALYGSNVNSYRVLMVVYHPIYQYLHMVLFTFPADVFRTNGRKVFDAEMSMFIPQHNIKSLFNDKQ